MSLKEQTKEELQTQCNDLSREIFELRNELSAAHKLDKPHLIRKKKRERARILTILNEKGSRQ